MTDTEMNTTDRAVQSLLCGALSALLMSIALLLVNGWRNRYDAGVVLALTTLSFSIGGQVRQSYGPRSLERWQRVRPYIIYPPVIGVLTVLLSSSTSAQIERPYAPVLFLYGAMVGHALTSAVGAFDYVLLAVVGFVTPSTIALFRLEEGDALMVVMACAVATQTLIGDIVWTGGRPPDVNIVDVGLSGPVLGVALHFGLGVREEAVPLAPVWTLVSMLIVLRTVWGIPSAKSRLLKLVTRR